MKGQSAKAGFTLTEIQEFCTQEGRLPVVGNAVEFSITDCDPDKAAPLEGRVILRGAAFEFIGIGVFPPIPNHPTPPSELPSVVLYANR